jgi:hypothetical protein
MIVEDDVLDSNDNGKEDDDSVVAMEVRSLASALRQKVPRRRVT